MSSNLFAVNHHVRRNNPRKTSRYEIVLTNFNTEIDSVQSPGVRNCSQRLSHRLLFVNEAREIIEGEPCFNIYGKSRWKAPNCKVHSTSFNSPVHVKLWRMTDQIEQCARPVSTLRRIGRLPVCYANSALPWPVINIARSIIANQVWTISQDPCPSAKETSTMSPP